MGISGEPTWLDRGQRSIMVKVHQPDADRTRGVLVVVGPVGCEGIVAFRAMRALAVRAASAGFTVVRFDWTGDGESGPVPAGEGIVDCWDADLADVLTLAESLAPGARPHVVGIRLAAALVARLPAERLASRVLWEPRSGRTHLRYHQKLRQVSIGVPTVPEGIEVIGGWFSDSDAEALRALRVPTDGPEVLREPDAAAVTSFIEAESGHAEIPWASINRLVQDLQGGDFPAAPFTPILSHRLTVDGVRVEETFVTVGPHDLPGVLTRPAEGAVAAGVAFAPSGSEPRTGPAHLWVAAGRRLAADGIASLRTDRRGQGELMDDVATRAPDPYNARGIEDATHTVAHLRGLLGDAPVVAAGLCAGAWTSALAALRTPVDAVVAYNNITWKPSAAAYANRGGRADSDQLAEGASTPHRTQPSRITAALRHVRTRLRSTQARNRAIAGWEHSKTLVARRAPLAAWEFAARFSRLEYAGHLVQRPGTAFRFHMGRSDGAHFRRCRGAEAFVALRADNVDITARAWADLDHGLLAESSRRRALSVLRDEVNSVVGMRS